MAILQASFKKSLSLLLQSNINEQKPLSIAWHCAFCHSEHNGNLFKKVTIVINDVVSGDFKADIDLISENQQLFAAIHISKNKKPIAEAIPYYQKKNIVYIQVKPDDDLFASITKPLYVGTCLNPKCNKCGGFQSEKNLIIIDCNCWKCKESMKVAVLESNGYHGGPDRFTANELATARDKGVFIQSNYSKTVRDSYLSNTCPHCQILTGDHFLFTDYYADAMYGYHKYESIPLGHFCKTCQ